MKRWIVILLVCPVMAFAQRGTTTTILPIPPVKGQAGKYLKLSTNERELEWATVGGSTDTTLLATKFYVNTQTALKLDLHATSDSSKASYWATSLRGAVDSARASYWASAVRGGFIDTSRASYYATTLRTPQDSTRASYWGTRLRGDTTTSAYWATGLRVAPDTARASYYATSLRVMPDSARAGYWATAIRGNFIDTSRASYWSSAIRGNFIDTSRAAYWATGLRVAPDTTRASYWSSNVRGNYLKPADSTTLKNALLKNADSTTLKNSLLKNADSTDMAKRTWVATANIRRTVPAYTASTSVFLRADSTWAAAGGSTTSVDSIRHKYVDTTGQAGAGKTTALMFWADSAKYKATKIFKFDTTGAGAAGIMNHLKLSVTGDTIKVALDDSIRASYWASAIRGDYVKPADSTTQRTYSTALYAPKASPTFTGRWTGSASIRGTATFTTTGVRVAVYIPGTASGDIVVCTPTLATVVTTTNLTAFAKTDSLIFLRGASGTSGAVLNWILMR